MNFPVYSCDGFNSITDILLQERLWHFKKIAKDNMRLNKETVNVSKRAVEYTDWISAEE